MGFAVRAYPIIVFLLIMFDICLIVLQIFNISYRSARIFLTNHEEYIKMAGLNEIPSFQTLSRRARMIDVHAIKWEIERTFSILEEILKAEHIWYCEQGL